MSNTVRLKKGLDIPLKGGAPEMRPEEIRPERIGIVPDDYPGYTWKPAVKAGDEVLRGTPLLYAKENPEIKLVSPASGRCEEIRRGERRKILAVTVRPGDDRSGAERVAVDPASDLVNALCTGGLWGFIRQRPFDIVPSPDVRPRDIFITAFDSAPLAPRMIEPSEWDYLEKGIRALASLTEGKVYLGVKYGDGLSSSSAVVSEFQGPHPAGNAGVQIAAVKPVNKGETVWTLDASVAVKIGKFLEDKVLDPTVRVAVTGEGVKTPVMVSTLMGCDIASLLKNNLQDAASSRIISGNVLTGSRVGLDDGFLRFPFRQITVIPEGDHADEFMGWASMNPKKYSVKRSFPAFLRGLGKPFSFDARLKGGERAMIVSGEYDKVFPMDIYPEFLIKAILARDIDRMEKLGIYEVAPEDFGLAEFVDTSKLPLQKIVREGLDYLRNEL